MKPVFAFLLALSAVAAPVMAATPHRTAPATQDWTQVVATTPDGGIRMGNPNAKVKLVEYFSFTCPHCAVFAGEAYGPLTTKYVRSGQVSVELRSALRDALDLVAALGTRCVAPRGYFGAVEDVMAAQNDWETKAAAWITDHRDELNGDNKAKAIDKLVDEAGLSAILAQHGVAAAAIDHCMQDKDTQAVLERTTNDAWNVRKIAGTPGFFINDAVQTDVFTWATLEPKIQAALKS